eukprot:2878360-Amphidinium_carterae.1
MVWTQPFDHPFQDQNSSNDHCNLSISPTLSKVQKVKIATLKFQVTFSEFDQACAHFEYLGKR